MDGTRAPDTYSLEREHAHYLSAAGLLSPVHGSGISGAVPTSGPPLFSSPSDAAGRLGAARGVAEMSGSAASAMSSLAQLQGRYMSQPLNVPGHGK